MFGSIGVPELIMIFVVALLLFGPRKLPDIGRSLGKALGEFRRASNDLKRTLEDEVAADQLREVDRDVRTAVTSPAPAGETTQPEREAPPVVADQPPAAAQGPPEEEKPSKAGTLEPH
jgi:sec-independent protein translocase protein TatA